MKKLFLGLVVCASSLMQAGSFLTYGTTLEFTHLNKLPQDSVLRSRCERVDQDWTSDHMDYSNCHKLNSLLEGKNTHTFASVKSLVGMLLDDKPADIQFKEYNKLMDVLQKLREEEHEKSNIIPQAK